MERFGMRIRVELFLHLAKHAPSGETPAQLDVPDGATVDSVLTRLGILGRVEKVVLVDGRVRDRSYALADGQTLTVFPPLEGG